ncbi:MAG: diaminopimelate decarboxylase [Pseudonocardiales bacterium]|nr:diaminopimelate decarboxylase [Pseudonocardiales bacterium]
MELIADAPAVLRLPHLPARLEDPGLSVLTGERGLLRELAAGIGGPYHLLFPERFDAAAGEFAAVLRDAGVSGRVYFAKKANKAACWMRRCAELGVCVDVASLGELRGALSEGVRGEALVVTGPAKGEELLRLAILHGSLLVVDALDELERVVALAAGLGRARILLRCLPPKGPVSRFGIDEVDLPVALERCAQARAAVRLEGFSFHLPGYEVAPRADIAGWLLGWCARARALGLPAETISIGGGFAVNYVDGPAWERFRSALAPEHFHAGRSFDDYYPYHSPVAGAGMLRAVLAAVPAGEAEPLSALLRRAGVALLCEPGRALLDQAGCTVFTVQGVKARDYAIVTVDGTSLSLSEQWFNSEFLPDPVLMPKDGRAASGPPFAACVAGASCLECDLLTWRKVAFPMRPRSGDLLVYVNTAGYQMDSNESAFHDLPLPPKLVDERRAGAPRWRFDEHPGPGIRR